MAKREPKKRKFELDRFFPLINALCIVFALANFVVIFFFERSRSPRIERIYETVTTNHVIIVTNYIESVSASPSPAPDSAPVSTLLSASEILVEYRYFMIGHSRYIEYCGRNFGEGAPTSYGRIKTIYPDRVELDNGVWLKNTTFSKPSEVKL